MDNLDQQVLDTIQHWVAAGEQFALITVAQTWGSAPRQPGAWLALRADGMVQGSVSGGCIEDDLIERMRSGRLTSDDGSNSVSNSGNASGHPFCLTYGLTRDEAQRYGLPCGGSLMLVVEPAPDAQLLAQLSERIRAGQLVQRQIDLDTGLVSLTPVFKDELTQSGEFNHAAQWNEHRLITQHGPQWRLLIIGAGQTSRFLAPMAHALGYAVTVCDPRPEYSESWNLTYAPLLPGMPDDVVTDMRLDPHSAVVALTHDPKLDDLALLEALKSPAFYVGALGSLANNLKRRARLQQYFNLSEAEIARLSGPVGLPIGSKTPAEIAVSIIAEMTAVKNRAPIVQLVKGKTQLLQFTQQKSLPAAELQSTA